MRTASAVVSLIVAAALAGCQPSSPAAGPQRSAAATPAATALPYDEFACYGPLDRGGFVVKIVEGRLWILREGSKELVEFQKFGELAKHVTIPGGGPGGMTVKAPDQATAYAYAYSVCKPGFVARFQSDRLWVFRPGSRELVEFEQKGELAKHVTLPAAGPLGMTMKSPDRQTALAFLASQPGFVTLVRDDRIWVARGGSKELAELKASGEIARHVTRPAAGPLHTTLMAPDAQTLDDYLAAGTSASH